jgi:hypothetical protein
MLPETGILQADIDHVVICFVEVPMRIALGIVGMLLAWVGAFLPPIQALFPKISLIFYYKQQLVRRLFYLSGAVLVILSMLFGEGMFTYIALVVVVLFIGMTEFLMIPSKVIPPLDRSISKTIQPGDLSGEAMLIGIELGGSSRAYPFSLLTPHHIINDSLGEIPVAATYCPACRSGYIYNPVVKGWRLTFEPVTVRRRNMVMKDRETGSVWQHETGLCLMGEFIGEQLEILPSEMCNWSSWYSEHPDTTVCFPPEGYRHPSPLGFFFEKFLDHGPEHVVGPGITRLDRRLGQHEFIIGIIVGGVPKAYPLTRLVEQGTIKDTVAGVPVTLVYDKKADRVRAFAGKSQASTEEDARLEPIPIVRQWWLAWSEYHPESDLY